MGRPPVSSSSGTAVAAPSAGQRTARHRIDEEHRELRKLLRSLGQTTDLARLETLLGQLRALLEHHFEGEEGPEGLHDIVREGAAHRLPNVQHLFDEHRAILARLDHLKAEVDGCLDGPVRRLLDGVGRLAETLRRHEADEEALFAEAFYTDIGGRA